MTGLESKEVRITRGGKEILKGISFGARSGEILAILGENGSGKTTLLNCINTEYHPDGGVILLSGLSEDVDAHISDDDTVDVRELSDPERARVLATVEQNSHQSFPFTVMETVRMGRYSRTGMFDEDEEDELDIICKMMEETGIIHLSDRRVDGLSGGEWRRVMIAQALAQEPEILLLDEPTLHLDISHQFDLMDMCKRIVSERDVVIAIVTHDLQLAARYADRVVVMRNGKVHSIGNAQDVITEEMVREVFHMESRIGYDEDIGGINVTLIKRV